MNKKIAILALLAIILFPLLGSVAGPSKANASGLTMTSLASQMGTVLSIDSDGRLWAWGANYSGQYGDGTNQSVTIPQRVDVTDQGVPVAFQKAASGFNSSVALDRSGHLWAAGGNNWGQLGYGNGVITESLVWGKITAQDSGADVLFKDVAVERFNAMAIDTQGKLWAWGTFRGYTPGQSYAPMKIAVTDGGTPVSFQSIQAVDENAIALDTRGFIWHINNVSFGPTKVDITEGGAPVHFQSISAGDTYNCGSSPCFSNFALDVAGHLWAWGSNTKGQLGDGTTTSTYTPQKLSVMDSGAPVAFTSVSSGDKYTLALDGSGTLWSWGFNDSGQLGDGTQTDRQVPQKILVADNGNPVKFTTVQAGYGNSQALDDKGQRWAWGANNLGQLGDGSYAGKLQPIQVRYGSTISLSVPAPISTLLEPLTLTATVTGVFGIPTGTIVFQDGATVLGSSPLDTDGKAVIQVSALPLGTHSLKAQYQGDRSYNASLSGVVAHQVNMPSPPSMSITQSPVDLTSGSVTLTVDVVVNGNGNSLDSLKWLQGENSAADFLNAGNDILAPKSFGVVRSGKYTVYAKGKAGNETVQSVVVDSIPSAWLTGVSLNGSSFTELEGHNQLILTGEVNHIDAGDPLSLQIELLNSQGAAVTQAVYSLTSSGLHQAFRHEVTITSAQFPSGSYSARVSISDASGEPFVKTLPFFVNTSSPVLRVTMAKADGKPYAGGQWTNRNVTASVCANVYETSSLASLTLSVDGGAGQPVANNSSFTVSQEGSHTVTYLAVDSMGHSYTQSYQVNIDRTPPVIALHGPSHLTLNAGDPYIEQGATVSDPFGVAGNVQIGGSVDTQVPGTYTVRYNALDLAGNAAIEAARTVTVTPVPPVENIVVTALTASPADITLQVGQSVSAGITAAYSDGKQADVTQDVSWSVTSSDVASAKDGVITGIMPGSTVVQAVYGGKTVDISVTVSSVPTSGENNSGSEDSGSSDDNDNSADGNQVIPPANPTVPPAKPKPEPSKSFVDVEKIIDFMKRAIDSNRTVSFTDMSSHWAANEIRLAAKLGIADGYPGGASMPDAPVTRAEFSKLLVQACPERRNEAGPIP